MNHLAFHGEIQAFVTLLNRVSRLGTNARKFRLDPTGFRILRALSSSHRSSPLRKLSIRAIHGAIVTHFAMRRKTVTASVAFDLRRIDGITRGIRSSPVLSHFRPEQRESPAVRAFVMDEPCVVDGVELRCGFHELRRLSPSAMNVLGRRAVLCEHRVVLKGLKIRQPKLLSSQLLRYQHVTLNTRQLPPNGPAGPTTRDPTAA
jgi:hypothetical protein